MENIFENACFGKAYKTRDGRKAILISYNQRKPNEPYVCAVACYLDNSIKSICCNFNKFGKRGNNDDIVSEWQEEIGEKGLMDLSCASFPCDEDTDARSFHKGFKVGYRKALKQ